MRVFQSKGLPPLSLMSSKERMERRNERAPPPRRNVQQKITAISFNESLCPHSQGWKSIFSQLRFVFRNTNVRTWHSSSVKTQRGTLSTVCLKRGTKRASKGNDAARREQHHQRIQTRCSAEMAEKLQGSKRMRDLGFFQDEADETRILLFALNS